MSTVSKQSKKSFPWWAVLLQGIFAVIFGFLLLTDPAATTAIIVQFLGFYWLIGGVIQLVTMFMDTSMWGWKLLSGILGILAGLVVIRHPLWSTILVPTVMVIFLGINGIIIGIIALVQAFKGAGWLSGILGVISIFIGIALLGSPLITALALPWVYGVIGIAGGFIAIYSAFKLKAHTSA
jgi:uncharacterized membrane protein HdeD (DUF308 family)